MKKQDWWKSHPKKLDLIKTQGTARRTIYQDSILYKDYQPPILSRTFFLDDSWEIKEQMSKKSLWNKLINFIRLVKNYYTGKDETGRVKYPNNEGWHSRENKLVGNKRNNFKALWNQLHLQIGKQILRTTIQGRMTLNKDNNYPTASQNK